MRKLALLLLLVGWGCRKMEPMARPLEVNVNLPRAEAEKFASLNGLTLVDCVDETQWCTLRGIAQFSTLTESTTASVEENGTLSIPEKDQQAVGFPGDPEKFPMFETRTIILDPLHQWGPEKMALGDALITTHGDPGIVVSIIDTGVRTTHNEFKDKVVSGRNTQNEHLSVQDDQGHGTHVAGSAVAHLNHHGVVGMCPDCSLQVVKALDNKGSGSFSDIVKGILWAVNNDADVINMSLGSTLGSVPKYIADALDYAENEGRDGKGTVVVAAAGNSGKGKCSVPALHPTVICVGAVNLNLNKTSWSNFGVELDGMAPGAGILSSTFNDDGGYGTMSGTSMAAPHVAGLAGLLLSNNPELTAAQVRGILNDTALETPSCDQCAAGMYHAGQALEEEPTPTPTPAPVKAIDLTIMVNVDNSWLRTCLFTAGGARQWLYTFGEGDPFVPSWELTEPGELWLAAGGAGQEPPTCAEIKEYNGARKVAND